MDKEDDDDDEEEEDPPPPPQAATLLVPIALTLLPPGVIPYESCCCMPSGVRYLDVSERPDPAGAEEIRGRSSAGRSFIEHFPFLVFSIKSSNEPVRTPKRRLDREVRSLMPAAFFAIEDGTTSFSSF